MWRTIIMTIWAALVAHYAAIGFSACYAASSFINHLPTNKPEPNKPWGGEQPFPWYSWFVSSLQSLVNKKQAG